MRKTPDGLKWQRLFFNFYTTGSDIIGESSGTILAKAVNPVVVEMMREKGISYVKQHSWTKVVSQYKRLIHQIIY